MYFDEEERFTHTSTVPPPNVGTRPQPPVAAPSPTPPVTTAPAPTPVQQTTAIPRGGNPAVDYRPVNAQTEELFINNRPTGKYRSPQKPASASIGAPAPSPAPGTSPPPGGTGGSGGRDEDGRVPGSGPTQPSVDPGQYAPPGSLLNQMGKGVDFGSFNLQDRIGSMPPSQRDNLIQELQLPDNFDFTSGFTSDKFIDKVASFISTKGIQAGLGLLGLTGPASMAAAWGLKKLLKNTDYDPVSAISGFIRDLTSDKAPEVLDEAWNDIDAEDWWEDESEDKPVGQDLPWGAYWYFKDPKNQWITDDFWKRESSLDGLAVGGVVDQTNRMLSKDPLSDYDFFKNN
jgi:hypothetical protein